MKKILSLILVITIFFSLALPLYAANKKNDDLFKINYKDYLKGKSDLGFSPDYQLFKSAYFALKYKYVNVPEDSTLIAGVNKEVNKLLVAAGKKPSFKATALSQIQSAISAHSANLNRDLLWYAAIQGMLFSLKDPYTLILPPKDFASLRESMEAASFGGVGLYLDADKTNNNQLTVFEPMEGTPAYRAGILPEDHILAINGESTAKMPIELAVKKMRGAPGSIVKFKVERRGQILNFTIKREKITVHSISCKLIEKRYGYIRVRTFGENTAAEFTKALNILRAKKISGLIIDLRNNGGGLINAAIGIASNLLPAGKVIVSVAPRSSPREYLKSDGRGAPLSVPIVILINKYSASASEILSGAMQDYSAAVLFGGKSYGKGSVQELVPLASGAAFKMTVAHYYTPKNRNIDKKGIEPDKKYDMDVRLAGRKNGDVQLKAAVKFLKSM